MLLEAWGRGVLVNGVVLWGLLLSSIRYCGSSLAEVDEVVAHYLRVRGLLRRLLELLLRMLLRLLLKLLWMLRGNFGLLRWFLAM